MSTTLAPKFISVPYGIIMSTSAHEILSGKSKYYMIDFIMADQKLMDKVDTIITERGGTRELGRQAPGSANKKSECFHHRPNHRQSSTPHSLGFRHIQVL